LWQIRGSLAPAAAFGAWADNWQFGRWLAGAEILTWCSSLHMYLYLAAELLGTAATGDLKAAQILFGPMRVFAYFLGTVLPIRFARTLAEAGDEAMRGRVKSVLVRMLPPLMAYCIAVAVLARPIMRVTFGPQYVGASTVLALYSGYAFLSYTQMIFAAALAAKKVTRYTFFGSACGAIVALGAALALIPAFGVNGILLAMIISTAVVTALYAFAYARVSAAKPIPFDVLVPAPQLVETGGQPCRN
jgi:O-antigen/teichoic acid export membrane protein